MSEMLENVKTGARDENKILIANPLNFNELFCLVVLK
jgi:hypothetical protein